MKRSAAAAEETDAKRVAAMTPGENSPAVNGNKASAATAKERFLAVLLRCLGSCAPEDAIFAMRTLPEARPVQLSACKALAARPPLPGEWAAAAAALRVAVEAHGADAELLVHAAEATTAAPETVALASGLLEALLKAAAAAAAEAADADAGAATASRVVAAIARLLEACAAAESTTALVALLQVVFWHADAATAAANLLGRLPAPHARTACGVDALVNVMRAHARCACGAACPAFGAAAGALAALTEGDPDAILAARAANAASAVGPRRDHPEAARLLAVLGKAT